MPYFDKVSSLNEFPPITKSGRSNEKSLTTDSGYCAADPSMHYPRIIQDSYTHHASNMPIDPSLAVSEPNNLYIIDNNGDGAKKDFGTDGNFNYQWQRFQ